MRQPTFDLKRMEELKYERVNQYDGFLGYVIIRVVSKNDFLCSVYASNSPLNLEFD